jgi:hypothetical protein
MHNENTEIQGKDNLSEDGKKMWKYVKRSGTGGKIKC